MRFLDGKAVLVTGGSGSIGSTLIETLVNSEVELVRILDNDESRLYEMKSRLANSPVRVQTELTNIRQRDQVAAAMAGIDFVFHTAALKHVGLVEQNPYSAVQTNILGTKNIVEAAIAEGVETVVAVSTDKASNPVSSMGATKLLAERIVTAANDFRHEHDTDLGCVRFGNVIGTRGSVVPVFLNQLAAGDPLTVTNGSMTRFVMLPEEASDFVINSAKNLRGGEIFVKKMPAFRVGDLASAVKSEFADRLAPDPDDVEIRYIGAQPGERFHEKLISDDEVRFTDERDGRFIILPNYNLESQWYDEMTNDLDGEYTSREARMLSEDEIVDQIEAVGAETLV